MKYLITNPDSFGDLVLRQPLFKGLLDEGHEVAVLVKRSYSQIIHFLDTRLQIIMIDDLNPYVISIFDDKPKVEVALDQATEFNPDVVVIAPYQRTLIDYWTLERFSEKHTIGMKGIEVVWDNGVRVFRPVTQHVTKLLQVPEELSEVEKNRRLLVLCVNKEVNVYHPTIQLPLATLQLAQETLKRLQLNENQYIICTPGSTSLAVKQYPVERFVKIFEHWFKEYGRQILLVSNEIERGVVNAIQQELKRLSIESAVWIGNDQQLEVLLGLISQSKIYCGNDTGTMHFAAALNKPVMAIFGGGTWPRFIPDAKRGAAFLQELPCFGCGWRCIFESTLCIHSVNERKIMKTIDDFENNKLKTFNILNQPFEGEIVTTWIQDAKTALKGYKEQFDVLQISRDKEKTELVLIKETLTKEANEAHKYVAKLRSELDDIYKNLAEKNQEIEQLQSMMHNQTERFAQEQRISQIYHSQMQEKDRQLNEQATQIQLLNQQHRKEVDVLRDEQKSLKHEIESERLNSNGLKTQLTEQNAQIQLLIQQHRKEIDSIKKELDFEKQNSNKLRIRLSSDGEQILLLKNKSSELSDQLTHHKEAVKNVNAGLIDIKPKLEEIHLSFRQQEEVIKHLEISLLGIIKSGWVRLGIKIGIPWLSRWYKGLFARDKETGVLIVLKPGWDNPLRLKEFVLEKINKLLRILDQSK